MHMVWEEVCVREPRQRESDIERQTHRNRQRETYINTTLDSRIASASQSSVKAFILCVCWEGKGGGRSLCAVDADLCEFACLLHYMHVYAQWTYTHAQTCKCTERFMCMHELAGLIMCVCVCVCVYNIHAYLHAQYIYT